MTDITRIYRELTSAHHGWRYYTAEDCPKSLSQVLILNLPHIDPESWEKRWQLGGTYVNGKRTFHDVALQVPCYVEYFEPKFDIDKYPDVFPKFVDEYVVYEDSDLVVVFKPPKLPSILTRDQLYCNLRTLAEKHLQCSLHLPSRLDHSAQGLMVLSKTKRMNLELHNAFVEHSIEKFYILEVAPAVTWQQKNIQNRIGRNPAHPVLRQVVEQDGKQAITEFTHLGVSKKSSSYLLARLITGRTHQLRVHSSYLGSPIIGDNFYSGIESSQLRLLSYQIRYQHPFQNKFLDVKVPKNLLPDWLKDVVLP